MTYDFHNIKVNSKENEPLDNLVGGQEIIKAITLYFV